MYPILFLGHALGNFSVSLRANPVLRLDDLGHNMFTARFEGDVQTAIPAKVNALVSSGPLHPVYRLDLMDLNKLLVASLPLSFEEVICEVCEVLSLDLG